MVKQDHMCPGNGGYRHAGRIPLIRRSRILLHCKENIPKRVVAPAGWLGRGTQHTIALSRELLGLNIRDEFGVKEINRTSPTAVPCRLLLPALWWCCPLQTQRSEPIFWAMQFSGHFGSLLTDISTLSPLPQSALAVWNMKRFPIILLRAQPGVSRLLVQPQPAQVPALPNGARASLAAPSYRSATASSGGNKWGFHKYKSKTAM